MGACSRGLGIPNLRKLSLGALLTDLSLVAVVRVVVLKIVFEVVVGLAVFG